MDKELTRTEKKLLKAIMGHMDDDYGYRLPCLLLSKDGMKWRELYKKGWISPTISSLAKEVGVSEATVRVVLKTLKSKSLIELESGPNMTWMKVKDE